MLLRMTPPNAAPKQLINLWIGHQANLRLNVKFMIYLSCNDSLFRLKYEDDIYAIGSMKNRCILSCLTQGASLFSLLVSGY